MEGIENALLLHPTGSCTFLDPNSISTNKIVIAQDTDRYEVVYALAEIDPALGGNPNYLLPDADTGMNFRGNGLARVIFLTDTMLGRWVSNVDAIIVETPGSQLH